MYTKNRGFEGGSRGGFAPVNVGDELDLKIENVGEKGDGIARVKGFVIFVPNAKQGEEVKVRITKVLRKVGFAEVIGKGSPQPSEEGSQDSDNEETYESDETPEEKSDDVQEDSEEFGEE